jgi:hypothetical protein
MKKIVLFLSFILFSFTINSQINIYTPTGDAVKAYIYDEYSAPYLAILEDDAADWIDDHGSYATRVAPASGVYNCHGYAWHNSDGGNAYWVYQLYEGNANVANYWSASNPAYQIRLAGPFAYTKIFYPNGDHSAKGLSATYCDSKWGSWPRYQHAPWDCPYTGSRESYWIPISGDYYVCSSKNYSTINISGATYNWDADKVTLSGTGSSRTATLSSNGEGWIQSCISCPSSGTNVYTGKRPIWCGEPNIPVTTPSGPEIEKQYDEYFNVSITDSPGADPYTGFAYASGSVEVIQPYGWYLEFHCYDYEWGAIEITTENECGISDPKDIYVYVPQGEKIASKDEVTINLSPNPATAYVDMNLKNVKSDKLFNNYTAEFIDSYSRIIRKFKLNGSDNRIQVQDLPAGYYILRITLNNKIYQEAIIIQKN